MLTGSRITTYSAKLWRRWRCESLWTLRLRIRRTSWWRSCRRRCWRSWTDHPQFGWLTAASRFASL